jgi:KaiC/GvpD/RAD55 family RecA-like ATPase
MGTRWRTSVYMSVKDTAQAIIKSINGGDTLTTVSIGADSFHSDTVKIAAVLLNKKLGGIYITTSRPSSHIIAELEGTKADLSDLYFVDLVSMTVGGKTDDPRTLYVESPTMLESILLNISLLERRLKAKKRFVMFDSVNGLSIYSEARVLKEFINVLGNSMRIKEIYSMLMTVKEQTSGELASALQLLSDKVIGE